MFEKSPKGGFFLDFFDEKSIIQVLPNYYRKYRDMRCFTIFSIFFCIMKNEKKDVL